MLKTNMLITAIRTKSKAYFIRTSIHAVVLRAELENEARATAQTGNMPKPLTDKTSSRRRDNRCWREGLAKHEDLARYPRNGYDKFNLVADREPSSFVLHGLRW